MRALALALLLSWPTVGALAAPPLAEGEVRTFMAGVEHAARARDVGRLAASLAPDCRIELRTRIGGQERVTLMTRDEYVGMLTSGYAALKDLEAYDYEVTGQQVTLERDPPAATVVSQVTETVVFGGRRQVTRSEETARVERRADGLKVVAVSALTSGD
ncbi:MAG TPA: hypothetical protein VMU00_11785 [Steroidobacteraceae bacterium]|nr:hypothetical protein [Steroidobacteraceae bacterium]